MAQDNVSYTNENILHHFPEENIKKSWTKILIWSIVYIMIYEIVNDIMWTNRVLCLYFSGTCHSINWEVLTTPYLRVWKNYKNCKYQNKSIVQKFQISNSVAVALALAVTAATAHLGTPHQWVNYHARCNHVRHMTFKWYY